MVAPKGPGHLVRRLYTQGAGVPCLIAVDQDASGHARGTALAWASGIGGGRAGVLETTFEEETITDLFGEQTVLCGGTTALVQAGFETLVAAGYQPEIAYFECLHELKLIVDLMYEGGLEGMRYSISDTAEYGDLTRGPRIVDAHVRETMGKILEEIRSGAFAEEFIGDIKAGGPRMKELRAKAKGSQIEAVGKELRAMMPFVSGGKKPRAEGSACSVEDEAEQDRRADEPDRADDREAREVALHDLRRAERRRADAEGAREAGVLAGVRQHQDDHAEREQHVHGDRGDADDLAHA